MLNPDKARQILSDLMNQPKKFLFGVDEPVYNCVMAMITPIPRDGKKGKEWAQAHVYLLDKPGRGKTALFTYLSAALRGKLGRVDGRPDMMPSDLTGYEATDRATGIRTLLLGPIHCNIFFYDEINRTPPKAQAVLLGAMEGGTVIMNVTDIDRRIIEAKSFSLYPVEGDPKDRHFFITFATANPIEFSGTYPLSEAQQERFTYSFRMGLPVPEDEKQIRSGNVASKTVDVVATLSDILDIQEMVARIKLSEDANELISRYLVNSRPTNQDEGEYGRKVKRYASPKLVEFINNYVESGCSPRRNFHMEAAAKAKAFMNGENDLAGVDHVKAIAPLTMEHVILLKPRALNDGMTARKVVQRIVEETPLP